MNKISKTTHEHNLESQENITGKDPKIYNYFPSHIHNLTLKHICSKEILSFSEMATVVSELRPYCSNALLP
ncbi:Hypothetical predicted protein [Octopus vulgaris]|uniref:Uncharacterized protein n=1 Tax=Octopus vulgaris TaxID=6645 RepID=A0AA36EW61_OCTVU|nr:Hypothetical predicted protein [Octopus vulgaris]